MAVIARSRLGVLVILLPILANAAPDKELYRPVSHVAAALTAGNATDAMTPFDKSFREYSKLSDYFGGLANAYQLTSEIEITDEQVSGGDASLSVRWTLTLSDTQTGYSDSRTGDVTVRLTLKDGKWKIVDFSPLDLFDPQMRKAPRR